MSRASERRPRRVPFEFDRPDEFTTKTTKTTKMEHVPIPPDVESIGRSAIEAGLKVHAVLGAGLLESAYEHCLAFELHKRGIDVRRQVALPIAYETTTLDAGYRIDLLLG